MVRQARRVRGVPGNPTRGGPGGRAAIPLRRRFRGRVRVRGVSLPGLAVLPQAAVLATLREFAGELSSQLSRPVNDQALGGALPRRSGRGRNTAYCPGRPLQRQPCFASRCARRAFGAPVTPETSAAPAA